MQQSLTRSLLRISSYYSSSTALDIHNQVELDEDLKAMRSVSINHDLCSDVRYLHINIHRRNKSFHRYKSYFLPPLKGAWVNYTILQ